MGEFMHDDICEQILVRLDPEDLIRYKSVCKSWKSLISHPRFVKAHHTRQANLIIPYNYFFKYDLEYYMVGSSNGLAFITSFDGNEVIVANPWTREERILQKPRQVTYFPCWGFGYDSLTDDYKVVYGDEGFGKIVFRVLSLKSNVWKHVGHLNYRLSDGVQIGTLCNGALHWVMYGYHPLTEGVVISFDLSKEVFKEINQPDDALRECSFLAIKNDWVYNNCRGKQCLLNRYNVKRCWENAGGNYPFRIESEETYRFTPTTVMPSLISPHLQFKKAMNRWVLNS